MNPMKEMVLREFDKAHGTRSIAQLHKRFGVDPNYEPDRPKVWRIGQIVAALLRPPLPVLLPVTGVRNYRLR